MADSAEKALALLRDGSHFQWYVIPLFALVVYVYASEVERKNWSLVLAGLAFWGMDWFNEIWNGLVFHFTGYAPVWGTPGNGSALVLLIGLNIEITFMFAIAGIAFSKMLPADKKLKILGIPNRLLIAVVGAAFCVFVECLLNWVGALTWEYPWWSMGAPWLIFLFGYLTFFLVAFWVFDMEKLKSKIITVGIILGFDVLCLIVFMCILKWI
ncbi:MAG: hypothetical protein PHO26_03735 [Dehalococcoidia bacterium]|nr:hypothetical protein [Dehalococcoidia bacterium]MDD5494431.1 hypothetical protein [Dehalococcoidia bacterium]